MRIHADRERCVGSGMCVFHAPDVFDQDVDGAVLVRVSDADPERDDHVQRAVDGCPTSALSLVQASVESSDKDGREGTISRL
jgi:ferredoxin